MVWDLTNFKNIGISIINEKPSGPKLLPGDEKPSEFSINQWGRCVAYNQNKDELVIGICNGTISVRESIHNLNERKFPDVSVSNEWFEVMKFSPNYKYLAVGCHDNLIYILDTNDTYKKLKTFREHSSYICCLDWDINSEYIQSICGKCEYFFFNFETSKFITSIYFLKKILLILGILSGLRLLVNLVGLFRYILE